ncbi:hypothetical protein D915_007210 [Fasciola hepatica]|uniref:Trematode PH-like domain-containing protein n=1 Tax=Fasciola hepatica TaxID=6192 RepID=A0A4E0R2C4_FASHE|nr:hypothetical protein D915_007210 [Fasciola hepatica]
MTKNCARRKAIWFEGHGELVRRVPLVDREAYDHEKAYELLPATKTVKPILRCKVYCLTDGIKVKKSSRFGQNPSRKFYSYKDIHRFYSFEDYPNILILGCVDPDKDTKTYEFLRMDESHVQELCQLLERAHSDCMYRLVEGDGGPQRYQSSQSSLTGDTDTAHDETDVQKTTVGTVSATANAAQSEDVIPVDSVDSSLLSPDECTVEPELVNHEQSAQEEKPQSPLSRVPEDIRRASLFKRLCANLDENELLAVDMKYIEPDGKQGNQIVDNGAIYLFVAHHRHPEREDQCDGIEQCYVNPENTAEFGFTTTYITVQSDS